MKWRAEKQKAKAIFSAICEVMDLFACTFCFPISEHELFSWAFSFCLFISYVYMCKCIRRHLKESPLFPGVASHDVKCENKTYKLKRSIEENSANLIQTCRKLS